MESVEILSDSIRIMAHEDLELNPFLDKLMKEKAVIHSVIPIRPSLEKVFR